ncbi:MAG: sulfatase [Halanaerobiales bacterium]
MKQKPNLIYIFADQLRYQSCGYAGDERAYTPNIDALANESMNLFNAVSGHPVCSAYRASLFTGKYTTSTGMVINELRMNPDHKCLAHVLNDAGYHTGYIGKWHLYANELGNHDDPKNSYIPPGENRLGFDDYFAGYNFHHKYYQGYYHKNSSEKIKIEGYEPDGQTDLAIKYLRKAEKKDKPFSLFLSYGTPHDPWTKDNVPDEYYEMFKDIDFTIPPNYSQEKDPYGDQWSNVDKSPDKIDEWMRVYYAMTANLDWNIGRLLKVVENLKLKENTIIVFSSDHGEMFGAHGRMKKNIFYEEAVRIPFLIRWPAEIKPGSESEVCLNTVDIMPTLLSLLDLEVPDEVEGMDLSKIISGKRGKKPQAAFLQNTGACAVWENGHEWRAVRDEEFTYAIYRVDGKELLFNNKKDPYQENNLADHPAYQDKLKFYQNWLRKKMNSINDNFEKSTYYKENWIKDRKIIRTATKDFDS